MTIDTWLKETKKQIGMLDAELIAIRCFAPTDSDRSWLVANNVVKITTDMAERAKKMVERRAEGEPLAYILGEKEFYGRKFMVRPGVLIPRPETENLIELIKDLPLPKQPRFLEIGTGSGCIAITLALEYPQSYVLASDISVRALDIARGNDCLHEGRIELIESNLLQDIEFLAEDAEGAEKFDVLVANLPYVDRSWKWLDHESLAYEPSRALYAGMRGLALYQRLFQEINDCMEAGELELRYVVVEADPCQHAELRQIAAKYGWQHRKTDGYGLCFEKLQTGEL